MLPGVRCCFGGADLRDEIAVTLRVCGVLVIGEERHATRDDFIERTRQARIVERQERRIAAAMRGQVAQFVFHRVRLRRDVRAPLVAFPFARRKDRQLVQRLLRRHAARDARRVQHRRQVDRRQAAPCERGLVHLDRRAVEFDRAHQRIERHRHERALPGVAEDEEVGRDRIAHQRGRELRRIDHVQAVARSLPPSASLIAATMSCAGNCMSGRVVNVPGIAS